MALDFHRLDNNEHLFELDDKTSTILEFKGLLKYFLNNKIDLELLGD